MRWYRRSRREKARIGFAKQAKWRTDVEYLSTLVRALSAQFGGMQEFIHSFVELYRELARDPATSKEAASGYMAMIKLLETVTKEQQSA